MTFPGFKTLIKLWATKDRHSWTKGQSGEWTAAQHSERLPASGLQHPFHPVATLGRVMTVFTFTKYWKVVLFLIMFPFLNNLCPPASPGVKQHIILHSIQIYLFPRWEQFSNKPWSMSNRQKYDGNQQFYHMISNVAQSPQRDLCSNSWLITEPFARLWKCVHYPISGVITFLKWLRKQNNVICFYQITAGVRLWYI